MDDEEDKHFCIVCNQTISGLLNYVVHRKNFCNDKKKSIDQANFPEKKTEGIAFEIKISEHSSQSKANESLSQSKKSKTSPVKYEIKSSLQPDEASPLKSDRIRTFQSDKTSPLKCGKSSLLQIGEPSEFLQNGEATSPLKETVGKTRNDGSLLDYIPKFSVENNPDNGVQIYFENDESKYVGANEELAESDADNKFVVGGDQVSEQFYMEGIPDNIRRALLGTADNLEDNYDSDSEESHGHYDNVTDLTMEETNTDKEVDRQDQSVVESDLGIFSITPSGAPKNMFSPDANGSSAVVGKLDVCKIKRKRKEGGNQRSVRKSAKLSSKESVKYMVICQVCDLQFNTYTEYAEHIKTRQHKNQTEKGRIETQAEKDSVEVKVGVSPYEEEPYLGLIEDIDKQKDDEFRDTMDEDKIDDNVSGDIESDFEPADEGDGIRTDKGDIDDETEESKDMGVMSRAHHCTVCDKMISSRHKMASHLLSSFHKTQAVGKEQQYLSLFEKYHRSVMLQSPFQCNICSFYFNSSRYLEDHLRGEAHKKVFENVVEDIMCSLCRFKTSSHEKLMSHLQSPSHVRKVKQKDKVCAIKICKKSPNGPRKYQIAVCNICPSEFSKKTSTKLHFQTAEHIRQALALEARKKIPKEEVEKGLDEISLNTESAVIENHIKEEEIFTLESDLDHHPEELVNGLSKNTEFGTEDEKSEELLNYGGTSLLCIENDTVKANANGLNGQNGLIMWTAPEPGIRVTDQNDMEENFDQIPRLKKASACKYCSFETQDYNEMRPHYMKEHAEMVKICEVCDLVFPHGKGYKLHVNSKDHQARIVMFGNETEGKFQCHVCKKKFAEEGYAKFHTAYYHFHLNTEDDVLRENGKNSITRIKYAEFLSIIENVSKKEILKCPECGSAIRKINMIGHLRGHTGEKPYKCNICTDAFLNSSSLRRHLLVHFGLWGKTCEICGERFKGQTSYNVHMEIHRAKSTSLEKTNICHICGDAFYVKRKLREHMQKHREKSYKCDIPGCLWAFTNAHALKRHMLTHSDENPFICPTCGYSTKSQKYLQSHEKIHAKDKFLQCEHCPYKTIKKTHLRRHMRIHLGTKPFKCPYCSYACNTHDNIRKHVLETSFHKGLKVYPCRLCVYSTNCTKEFRTHLLTAHDEITADDLRGGSLAAFTGLFNKEEDIQAPVAGMEIFPCKERKTRRKIKTDVEEETVPLEQESTSYTLYCTQEDQTPISNL